MGTIMTTSVENVPHNVDTVQNAVPNEFQIGHFEHHQHSDHGLTLVQTFFRNYFGPVLLHRVTKIFVALLFIVYLALSIWGSILMNNGLQPDKLVPKNHYVHKFLLADLYWNDGLPLQILLNNPPNISIYENRRKIYAMVENFENTEHTMDSSYTMLWMREYELWLNSTGFVDSPKATEFNPENIKQWLKFTGSYEYWKSCIEWGNASKGEDPMKMKAFRFSVSYTTNVLSFGLEYIYFEQNILGWIKGLFRSQSTSISDCSNAKSFQNVSRIQYNLLRTYFTFCRSISNDFSDYCTKHNNIIGHNDFNRFAADPTSSLRFVHDIFSALNRYRCLRISGLVEREHGLYFDGYNDYGHWLCS